MIRFIRLVPIILCCMMCTPGSEKEESEPPKDPFEPDPPSVITPIEIPKITLPVATNINAWLLSNADVAETLIWYEEGSGWIPWEQWSSGLKGLLQDAYQFALNGNSIAPITPLENHVVRELTEAPATILSFEDSRNLFFSQIAWSILLDAQNLVPWKLSDLNSADLSLIFDGRQYFDEKEGCTFPNGTLDSNHKWCTFMGLKIKSNSIIPAPGHWTYGLLLANNLIGSTRKSTISRVCEWISDNYAHMTGPNKEQNMLDLYGSKGLPSLINMIEAEPFIPGKDKKPMYACWGATQFLKILLAQVNIPVEHFVATPGHRLPYFTSEGLALSHGDDLYNGHFRNSSTFPVFIPFDEVFITEEKFIAWFGPQTTKDERGKNIGRRMDELSIQYLTFPIITSWCKDLEEGNSVVDSYVYAKLKDHYTLQQLNEIQLWQKLTGKVETMEHSCHELYKYYE